LIANTLGVTADTLLIGNQINDQSEYHLEFARLIDDCNSEESRFIYEMASAAKNSLRNNEWLQPNKNNYKHICCPVVIFFLLGNIVYLIHSINIIRGGIIMQEKILKDKESKNGSVDFLYVSVRLYLPTSCRAPCQVDS